MTDRKSTPYAALPFMEVVIAVGAHAQTSDRASESDPHAPHQPRFSLLSSSNVIVSSGTWSLPSRVPTLTGIDRLIASKLKKEAIDCKAAEMDEPVPAAVPIPHCSHTEMQTKDKDVTEANTQHIGVDFHLPHLHNRFPRLARSLAH